MNLLIICAIISFQHIGSTTTVIAIAVALGGACLILILVGVIGISRRIKSRQRQYAIDQTSSATQSQSPINYGYFTDLSGVYPAPENNGSESGSDNIVVETITSRKPSVRLASGTREEKLL